MRIAALGLLFLAGCSSTSSAETPPADSSSDVGDAPSDTTPSIACCPIEGPVCEGGCFYIGGPDNGAGCPEICGAKTTNSKLVSVGGCPKVVLSDDSSCSSDASTAAEVDADAAD